MQIILKYVSVWIWLLTLLLVCFFFHFILVSVLPTASLFTDSKIRAIPSWETLTGLFYPRPWYESIFQPVLSFGPFVAREWPEETEGWKLGARKFLFRSDHELDLSFKIHHVWLITNWLQLTLYWIGYPLKWRGLSFHTSSMLVFKRASSKTQHVKSHNDPMKFSRLYKAGGICH